MKDEIVFPGADEVLEVQTHTSIVYLLPEEVYKVKKPVDFSFLDYSTLDRRRECCEKEVSLNRRFSPEVYLGVVPLVRRPDGRLEPGGDGPVAEWAVRMRRLPRDAMLSRRLAADSVRPREMEELADILARFYATAATGPEIAAFGTAEQVGFNTDENFETTLDFDEEVLPDLLRQFLRAVNRGFLSRREELFAARIRAGRVLDGHGDLKPENIFLTADGPVITDCIEFNDRFRYGDVLSDIAYLTMALLHAGRPDLREAFLARFREKAEPDYPEDLLAYYETYRAVVKGKIEGYRARQPEVPAGEREEARRFAVDHFRLARDMALGFRPVRIEGRPGGRLRRLLDNAFGDLEERPGETLVLRVGGTSGITGDVGKNVRRLAEDLADRALSGMEG